MTREEMTVRAAFVKKFWTVLAWKLQEGKPSGKYLNDLVHLLAMPLIG